METQTVHHPPGLPHQHISPLVILTVASAGDPVNPVPREVPHIGLITTIEIRVMLWSHVPSASPVLVADSEELQFPRLFPAVFPAEVGDRTLAVKSDVLDPFLHFPDRAASDVPADVGFALQLFAKVQKLMRTEMIILGHTSPMGVDHSRTVIAGAYAVFPVVFIGKTPPRPAENRDFYLFQSFHDVAADSPHVFNRTVLPCPIAVINAAPEMFRKMAVNIFIDRVLPQIGVDYDPVLNLRILIIQSENKTYR